MVVVPGSLLIRLLSKPFHQKTDWRVQCGNLASFGALGSVTLPTGESADGLVHISQLIDGFVEDVSSVVEAGQNVKVRVISVDLERGKMSLSTKAGVRGSTQSARPPADLSAFEGISSDQRLTSKVAPVDGFGAFVTVTVPDGRLWLMDWFPLLRSKMVSLRVSKTSFSRTRRCNCASSWWAIVGKMSLTMKPEDY